MPYIYKSKIIDAETRYATMHTRTGKDPYEYFREKPPTVIEPKKEKSRPAKFNVDEKPDAGNVDRTFYNLYKSVMNTLIFFVIYIVYSHSFTDQTRSFLYEYSNILMFQFLSYLIANLIAYLLIRITFFKHYKRRSWMVLIEQNTKECTETLINIVLSSLLFTLGLTYILIALSQYNLWTFILLYGFVKLMVWAIAKGLASYIENKDILFFLVIIIISGFIVFPIALMLGDILM